MCFQAGEVGIIVLRSSREDNIACPASNVVALEHQLQNTLSHKKGKKRIVLLQGPVGPFFSDLQNYLEKQGYDCWRILFNAGDRFYSGKKKKVVYNGSRNEWASWFHNFLTLSCADCIVLFGAERIIHKIARQCAQQLGVSIVSLEEGYIRPGFITVEKNGNNGASPIAGLLPSSSFNPDEQNTPTKQNFNGFSRMCWYGTLYYSIGTLFSSLPQRELFHRRINLFGEAFGWLRNACRRFKNTFVALGEIQTLLEFHEGEYFLIPLQVTTDMQLADAAMGWNNSRLIMETLKSFATHAPKKYRLVFKIHPLERGHSNDHRLIRQTAELLGIHDRVHVLDNGSLGLLARHAAGMITINSTSGLSAIFHGIPLLVIGRALYANPKLANCAFSKPDFDMFWTNHYVANKELRQQYLDWIKVRCLKTGDFYNNSGIDAACQGVYDVIENVIKETTVPAITELKIVS